MKSIITTILFITSLFGILHAQKDIYNTNTRTVVVNCKDSIIKADVLTIKEDFKITEELKYWWYNNKAIGYNRGGVNGKPLHGTFCVYNKEELLIAQGEFEYGLKTGKWKRWYPSGELMLLEQWKDGLKHGDQKYFSETGELKSTILYKKGVLVDSQKESFFKKVLKGKESVVVDSTQTVNNSVETE